MEFQSQIAVLVVANPAFFLLNRSMSDKVYLVGPDRVSGGKWVC